MFVDFARQSIFVCFFFIPVTCTEECLHGGQCIEDGVIARCQCKYGYRGRACEVCKLTQ